MGSTAIFNLPYAAPGDPADGSGNEQSMMTAVEPAIIGGFVRKTSNQTVTASTTLTNDTQLFLPVVANATYFVEVYLIYSGLAAAGFKVAFAGPSGATMSWAPWGLAASVTTASSGILILDADSIAGFDGLGVNTSNSNVLHAWPHGILRTSSTAGTIQFQWAQTTSNATGSVVYTDSFMLAKRLA